MSEHLCAYESGTLVELANGCRMFVVYRFFRLAQRRNTVVYGLGLDCNRAIATVEDPNKIKKVHWRGN